jgi:hypothetical protein
MISVFFLVYLLLQKEESAKEEKPKDEKKNRDAINLNNLING